MTVTLMNFDTIANNLLGCFSIPNNYHYLRTEAGMKTIFQQAVSIDTIKNNKLIFIVRKKGLTHTLFKIFSNAEQQRYVNETIQQATLKMEVISQNKINCEFICDYLSKNFDNKLISLRIFFDFKNNSIEIASVSVSSKLIDDSQLSKLPVIISLTMPHC